MSHIPLPHATPPCTRPQVLCWGVRDMKRYQLLQVTSPLVEMECGGTVIRSENIKNTKENPNFPKPVISFDVVSVQCGAKCNVGNPLGHVGNKAR